MSLAESTQEKIKQALELVGTSITLKKPSESNYDLATGTTTTTDPILYDMKAGVDYYGSEEIDNNSVKVNDVKLTIVNDGTEISASSDTIIFDGIEHNIIKVSPQFLLDTKVAYVLQIRK